MQAGNMAAATSKAAPKVDIRTLVKRMRGDDGLRCLSSAGNKEYLQQLVTFAADLRYGISGKPHQQWMRETVKKFKELYG